MFLSFIPHLFSRLASWIKHHLKLVLLIVAIAVVGFYLLPALAAGGTILGVTIPSSVSAFFSSGVGAALVTAGGYAATAAVAVGIGDAALTVLDDNGIVNEAASEDLIISEADIKQSGYHGTAKPSMFGGKPDITSLAGSSISTICSKCYVSESYVVKRHSFLARLPYVILVLITSTLTGLFIYANQKHKS